MTDPARRTGTCTACGHTVTDDWPEARDHAQAHIEASQDGGFTIRRNA